MMRVLVLSTVFPSPQQPLHGLFVLERIRHAARLCEIQVVAPTAWYMRWAQGGRFPRREVRSDLTVQHPVYYYFPRWLKILDGWFLFISVLSCVRRIRREFDFDLIDAHFGYPEGFAGVLLGRRFGRPVTITLRGSEPPLLANALRRRALGWALQQADAVVAVANPLAHLAHGLGVPRDRVEVIQNGVDTARFAPQDQGEARKLLGVPGSSKLLVSVGSLVKRKGFHRVLRVLPELVREHPDLILALVGGPGVEGNQEAQLRRLTQDLGISRHVIWAGAQPPDSVATWLNAGDVFVLASDHEGCPNVVWEALACGRPVVATKVGEVEQMVPPFCGLLVEHPADTDALLRRLREALNRPWHREAIIAHARKHTWDKVAERVVRRWRMVVEMSASSAVLGDATGAVAGHPESCATTSIAVRERV